MRLSGTKTGSINQYRGLGDQLWDLGGARPSLDLNFAHSKSLVDATTGSNLVDHTRASSGTYVGSDGLIKTAVTNLLLWSEDFSQANWNQNTNVTLAACDVAAPDGTFTATTASNPTTGLSRVGLTVTGTATTNYVGSIWARRRSGTGDTFLRVAENNPQAISLTTEWQRVWATDESTTTTIRFYIDFYDTGNAIDIWGAQLEQSDTVGEYVKTTSTINSAPRFDHDPTTGESLGLLVEESRTNLLLQSEDFSTTWGGVGTIDANAVVAPDGTLTADTITTATNAVKSQTSQSFAAGSTLTVSVFAKKNVTNFLRFEVANSVNCWYNLDTGAIGTNTAGSGNVLFSAKSIQSYPNGWYRCILTLTTSTVTTVSVLVFATTNDNQGVSGGESIHVWGAQLESGSFPTSYIPTTTATVTRAADVASITGSNFSSWYRQDEGTVFYEGQVLGSDQSSIKDMLGLTDGTYNEFAKMFIPVGINQRFKVDVGGVTQVLKNAILPADVYSPVKAAFALKLNDTTCAGDGIVQPEDTSCLIPAVDRFVFGTPSTGESELAARYKRLTYWPQRLSNDTLQTITQ